MMVPRMIAAGPNQLKVLKAIVGLDPVLVVDDGTIGHWAIDRYPDDVMLPWPSSDAHLGFDLNVAGSANPAGTNGFRSRHESDHSLGTGLVATE
jgi:hypothetical protein